MRTSASAGLAQQPPSLNPDIPKRSDVRKTNAIAWNYLTHPQNVAPLSLRKRLAGLQQSFRWPWVGPSFCSFPAPDLACRMGREMAVKKHEIWAEILGVEFFWPEILKIPGWSAPKNPRLKFRVKFRVVTFQNPRRVGGQKSACSEAKIRAKIRVKSA